jgi:hypothetical protein
MAQSLLRHADITTILGLYSKNVNSSMVEAQEAMLKERWRQVPVR